MLTDVARSSSGTWPAWALCLTNDAAAGAVGRCYYERYSPGQRPYQTEHQRELQIQWLQTDMHNRILIGLRRIRPQDFHDEHLDYLSDE